MAVFHDYCCRGTKTLVASSLLTAGPPDESIDSALSPLGRGTVTVIDGDVHLEVLTCYEASLRLGKDMKEASPG